MEISISDKLNGSERKIELYRQYVTYAFDLLKGKKIKVAEFLGMNLKTLNRYLKLYELEKPRIKIIKTQEQLTEEEKFRERSLIWIKENVNSYPYMDDFQKNMIKRVVEDNYEDLFFGRKSLADLL